MRRQKADPILIEQKNLINMVECVATVQDNGTIIRNRSRNASLSVCHSRVLPCIIDLALATTLPHCLPGGEKLRQHFLCRKVENAAIINIKIYFPSYIFACFVFYEYQPPPLEEDGSFLDYALQSDSFRPAIFSARRHSLNRWQEYPYDMRPE